MSGAARVVAVIVAYGPEPERFARVLAAAKEQVDAVVVVDNARGTRLEGVTWSELVERLDMRGNAGVAAAQNAGVRRAFESAATHVLILDHDSVLQSGAVSALLETWQSQTAMGRRVAAVGPNYRDKRRPAVSPFIRIEGWRYKRVAAPTLGAAIVSASYLVSSGSLISREAFEAVGPMKESFFVDYVDIEWGFRAGLKGWHCFGTFDAEMEHVLGDAPLAIFGRPFPLHSPLRHYYMARNVAWLITRTPIPLGCKFAEGWRMLRRSFGYALFAAQPGRHACAMVRGLGDGLRGRLGAYPRKARPRAS